MGDIFLIMVSEALRYHPAVEAGGERLVLLTAAAAGRRNKQSPYGR